jgi:hypothetical protein
VSSGPEIERFTYARPMPAVTAVKETARACAARHQQTAGLVLRVTIDPEGTPRGVATDVGDRDLAACVTNGIRQLRFVEAHHDKTLVFRIPPGA